MSKILCTSQALIGLAPRASRLLEKLASALALGRAIHGFTVPGLIGAAPLVGVILFDARTESTLFLCTTAAAIMD